MCNTHKQCTVKVGYNDAGRNDNLDLTTKNVGTGFVALETPVVRATTLGITTLEGNDLQCSCRYT